MKRRTIRIIELVIGIAIAAGLVLLMASNVFGATPSVKNDRSKLVAKDAHARKKANGIMAAMGVGRAYYIYLVDNGKILASVKSYNLPIRKGTLRTTRHQTPWVIIITTGQVILWDGKIIVTNSSKVIKGVSPIK